MYASCCHVQRNRLVGFLKDQSHPVRALTVCTTKTRIYSWSEMVLAAEAKKAGRASEDTRLTPRHPSLGKRA